MATCVITMEGLSYVNMLEGIMGEIRWRTGMVGCFHMLRQLFLQLVLFATVVSLCGCSTWRGFPSHGGGKRFDEEQRVVAGAIRQAVADMNLEELAGTKVSVTIDSIGQNGGGSLTLPGLNNIAGNYSDLRTTTVDRIDNTQVREGWGASASLSTNVDLKPTVFASETDLKYFEASLNMKLRHIGTSFAPKNPDYMLYVLVDVLGTNRSRDGHVIFWTDKLSASCEITYYAVDAKTNELIFHARRSSSESCYSEKSAVGFNAYHVERMLEASKPSPMPVDINDLLLIVPPSDGAVSPEPNIPEPSSFAQTRKQLEQKLRVADTQMQAGNFTAAEGLINEVRSIDPDFPGLDSVYSRLQALRNQNSDENSSKK